MVLPPDPEQAPHLRADRPLAERVVELLDRPRGLLLVTGPTGSGKTTTLATMVNYINENDDRHIITIEDPIEYFHEHKKSIVTQREVGTDVPTFAEAIRRALRQDPDVILVGEMRDLETIATAITAAETGHLVFGTLHTTGAARTVDRIIDEFPPEQQEQIRVQLSVAIIGGDQPGADAARRRQGRRRRLRGHGHDARRSRTSSARTRRSRSPARSRRAASSACSCSTTTSGSSTTQGDHRPGDAAHELPEPARRCARSSASRRARPDRGRSPTATRGTKKLLGQVLKEMKAVHEGMIQEALSRPEEGGRPDRRHPRPARAHRRGAAPAWRRSAARRGFEIDGPRRRSQFTPDLVQADRREHGAHLRRRARPPRGRQARRRHRATRRTSRCSTTCAS